MSPNTLLDRPAPSRARSPHEDGRRRRRGGWRRLPGIRHLRHAVRGLHRSARRLPGWALPALAVAAGLYLLLVITDVGDARRHLSVARSALSEARTAVSGRDTGAAAGWLDQADAAFARAVARTRRPELRLLTSVPLIGSPVKGLAAGGSAGHDAVAAGRILNGAAAALPTSGQAGLDGHDLSALHQAAAASDAALGDAFTKLDQALVTLEGPAGAFLPQVSSPAKALVEDLLDAQAQLNSADRGLRLVSRLTDPATNARILLLSQDTMEIRPSGGYVGSWGVIKIAGGTFSLEQYHSFEALPDPEPAMAGPADLAAVADRPFDLSNVGFWPDFPTTARTATELFARQGGGAVDGVVAVTENTMARLVGILGPIHLADYAKPVTEEGFAERVLYEVELKRPQDNPRKKFLQDLSDELFHRLFSLPSDKVPAVLQALGRSAGTGDLQAWFARPDWQVDIGGTALDGALPVTDEGNDFLLVTEANMSASKANAELTRSFEYRVTNAEGGRLKAALRIEYRNDGPESIVNPYYNGRVRAYVPHGVELVGGSGEVDDDPLAPYASIADDVWVDPAGGTAVVEFEYLLPEGMAPGGHYSLTWLRQPGMGRDAMSATVAGRSWSAEPGGRRLTVDTKLGKRGLSRFLPW